MSPYPRDEFDDVPESTERRGVHRTVQPRSATALKPILITGVIVLLLGAIVYFAFPSFTGRSEARQAATPPASTAPTATAPTTATPSTTPSAPAVDKSVPVSVYNGTRTAGLAAKYRDKVAAAGWKLGPVGNWGGVAQQSSVVFYNAESAKDSAAALASELGIARVQLAADLPEPLVVVVGPGAS